MEKIITYFAEDFIKNFEGIQERLWENPKHIAEFVYALSDELKKLGMEMFKYSLEEIDAAICKSGKRKQNWHIEKHTSKKLITTLGTIDFNKTLFTNKESGEMTYLVDKILGLSPHQLLTEDAMVKVYEEAADTSYRRGGEAVNTDDAISREAVKDILHNTRFPQSCVKQEEKRKVDYLYIDADEDHLSLQFQEKKGDIEKGKNGRKKKGLISKLIYVYEGCEAVKPGSKRHKLINTRYFCRVTGDNEGLWDEVWKYIESTYETAEIKQIYINGDGGNWIKAGCGRIPDVKYVLDEFHLSKYLLAMTGHMMDTQQDARIELCNAIRNGTKKEFLEIVERLKWCTEKENIHTRIEECSRYIITNWGAAKLRLKYRKSICSCSAEGHVSHVLSSRMSSRPMGWSKVGAEKMTQLREWKYNKESMLELVRYQKNAEELPKASGCEHMILSANDIFETETDHRPKVKVNERKYEEILHHPMTYKTKKQIALNLHKWI